jgi:hypothetical protein
MRAPMVVANCRARRATVSCSEAKTNEAIRPARTTTSAVPSSGFTPANRWYGSAEAR